MAVRGPCPRQIAQPLCGSLLRAGRELFQDAIHLTSRRTEVPLFQGRTNEREARLLPRDVPSGRPPAGELVSRRLTPPAQPTGTESAQTLLIPRESPVPETNVVLVS